MYKSLVPTVQLGYENLHTSSLKPLKKILHRIPVLGAALVKVIAVAAALLEVVDVVVDLTLAVVASCLVTAVAALVVAVVADRG